MTCARTSRDLKPKLRGWLHLGHRAADPGRRDRADRPLPRHHHPDRLGGLHRLRAGAVHGLGDLPHRHLVAADLGVPAPLRPRQHLPADRRLLHAVQPAAARGHRAAGRCWSRSGPGRSSACCSGSSGPTRRAGSTPRSTSRWAGPRSSSSPASSTAPPRSGSASAIAVFVLIGVGGALYTAGRRRLRLQAPQPVAALVRLPRGLPLVHVLAFASHYVGDLDGDVRPALRLRLGLRHTDRAPVFSIGMTQDRSRAATAWGWWSRGRAAW